MDIKSLQILSVTKGANGDIFNEIQLIQQDNRAVKDDWRLQSKNFEEHYLLNPQHLYHGLPPMPLALHSDSNII